MHIHHGEAAAPAALQHITYRYGFFDSSSSSSCSGPFVKSISVVTAENACMKCGQMTMIINKRHSTYITSPTFRYAHYGTYPTDIANNMFHKHHGRMDIILLKLVRNRLRHNFCVHSLPKLRVGLGGGIAVPSVLFYAETTISDNRHAMCW